MVILQVTQLTMFESVDLTARPNWKLRIVLAVAALVIVAAVVWLLRMTGMPLKSYAGPLPPLTSQGSELRDHLAVNVKYLVASDWRTQFGRAGSLEKTATFIRENLQSLESTANVFTDLTEEGPVWVVDTPVEPRSRERNRNNRIEPFFCKANLPQKMSEAVT
jgi:hypothetical protein